MSDSLLVTPDKCQKWVARFCIDFPKDVGHRNRQDNTVQNILNKLASHKTEVSEARRAVSRRAGQVHLLLQLGIFAENKLQYLIFAWLLKY